MCIRDSLIGLAVMMLQSCDVADNRRDMLCGNWESVEGKPDVLIYKEVSAEEYLAYTTEETEKVEVYRLAEKLGGDIEAAIRELAERRRNKE